MVGCSHIEFMGSTQRECESNYDNFNWNCHYMQNFTSLEIPKTTVIPSFCLNAGN